MDCRKLQFQPESKDVVSKKLSWIVITAIWDNFFRAKLSENLFCDSFFDVPAYDLLHQFQLGRGQLPVPVVGPQGLLAQIQIFSLPRDALSNGHFLDLLCPQRIRSFPPPPPTGAEMAANRRFTSPVFRGVSPFSAPPAGCRRRSPPPPGPGA